MSEEELQEQIIQQIEVLVEELGGTMCHLTKCSYTGRQSKVIEIEYNVEEKNSWKKHGEYGQKHLEKSLVNPIRRQIPLQKFVLSFLFN